MPHHLDNPAPDRYDLETLKRVITEATRAEQRRLDSFTRKDIENIASELGIEPVDLEAAFRALALPERDPLRSSKLKNWITRLIVGSTGAVAALTLNSLQRMMDQPYFAYTALGTLVALVCSETVFTWNLKGKSKHVVLQSVNLALWGGWSLICFTVIGAPEAGIPGALIGAASGLLGSVLLFARDHSDSGRLNVASTEIRKPVSDEITTRDNIVERIHVELARQSSTPRFA